VMVLKWGCLCPSDGAAMGLRASADVWPYSPSNIAAKWSFNLLKQTWRTNLIVLSKLKIKSKFYALYYSM
jgi:hypothetical protein